jgi:hypothetical protein
LRCSNVQLAELLSARWRDASLSLGIGIKPQL